MKRVSDLWERLPQPRLLNIPKENSPHSYMILENGVFYWKDVDAIEIYHTRVL